MRRRPVQQPTEHSSGDPKRLSSLVAQHVRRLRQARRWTTEELASRMTAAGFPITRSVMANIETGRPDADGKRRREVTVDELFAFAEVFAVKVDDLVSAAPPCSRCMGVPPAGFACTKCGAVGPESD